MDTGPWRETDKLKNRQKGNYTTGATRDRWVINTDETHQLRAGDHSSGVQSGEAG